MINSPWDDLLFQPEGRWLLIKLIFVILLYVYFHSLNRIFKQQMNGIFKYTSQQLRIWNEVATIFLVVIVMLAVVKQSMSFIWGLVGLIAFIVLLMSAIRIYKIIRSKNRET
jgi:putative membrane protein